MCYCWASLGKAWLHPLDIPLQILIHIDVLSHLSLHKAKQAQLTQPLLIREILHALAYLCSPPLDLFQQHNVSFVRRSPELVTALQMWPH